jgi:hypothetical protein
MDLQQKSRNEEGLACKAIFLRGPLAFPKSKGWPPSDGWRGNLGKQSLC